MNPLDIVKAAAEKVGWGVLQETLGVTRQTIWNWKCGARGNPSGKVVLKCLEIINGGSEQGEQLEQHVGDAGTIEFI